MHDHVIAAKLLATRQTMRQSERESKCALVCEGEVAGNENKHSLDLALPNLKLSSCLIGFK